MIFADAAIPMAVSLTITILLLKIAHGICKNTDKSALYVSGFLVFFYYYGAFVSALGYFIATTDQSPILPAVLWMLAGCLGFIFVYRLKAVAAVATSFLNFTALVLLVLNLLVIGDYFWTSDSEKHEFTMNPETSASLANLPDIYYLVIDGYACDKILKSLYGMETNELTDFLKNNNFYIPSASRSNYMQTSLSLASTLNMSYLDHLAGEYQNQNTAAPLMNMVRNNSVMSYFKGAGYKTVAFASGYATTEFDQADLYHGKTMINREVYHILLNNTVLAAFRFNIFDFVATQVQAHDRLIKSVVEGLAGLEIADTSPPVFVFAHLPMPHPPFIYNASGELKLVQPRGFHFGDGNHWGQPQDYRREYIEQLIPLNRLLIKALSGILAKGNRKKIIIIQADHGPGSLLNWEDHNDSWLPERFLILNAYFFPDGDYSALYDEISPVNSFGVVFNKIFNTNIDRLPDKNFFSPWSFRYRFTEVTDVIGQQLDHVPPH